MGFHGFGACSSKSWAHALSAPVCLFAATIQFFCSGAVHLHLQGEGASRLAASSGVALGPIAGSDSGAGGGAAGGDISAGWVEVDGGQGGAAPGGKRRGSGPDLGDVGDARDTAHASGLAMQAGVMQAGDVEYLVGVENGHKRATSHSHGHSAAHSHGGGLSLGGHHGSGRSHGRGGSFLGGGPRDEAHASLLEMDGLRSADPAMASSGGAAPGGSRGGSASHPLPSLI